MRKATSEVPRFRSKKGDRRGGCGRTLESEGPAGLKPQGGSTIHVSGWPVPPQTSHWIFSASVSLSVTCESSQPWSCQPHGWGRAGGRKRGSGDLVRILTCFANLKVWIQKRDHYLVMRVTRHCSCPNCSHCGRGDKTPREAMIELHAQDDVRRTAGLFGAHWVQKSELGGESGKAARHGGPGGCLGSGSWFEWEV